MQQASNKGFSGIAIVSHQLPNIASDNAAVKHPVKTDCCGKHAAETNI